MYVATWEEFSQRAKSLYLADPMRTRYCIRYDHSGSSLVVKVTDDVKVLQFKTDQQADAKKLDELNAFFLSLMAGADPDDVSAAAPAQKSAAESGVLTKRPKRRN